MNFPENMTLAGDLYTRYQTIDDDNKLVYLGEAHSDLTRQTIEFIRTSPKRSGNSYGVRRGYVRTTEDRQVDNADGTTTVMPSITTVAINWPVGVADPTAVVADELQKVICVSLAGADSLGVSGLDGSLPDALDSNHEDQCAELIALARFFEIGAF
jgi:hypothetical protein